MAGALPPQEIAFRLGSLSDYLAAAPQSSGQLAQPTGTPPKAQVSRAAGEDVFLAPALQLLAGYLLDADVGVIRATQSTLRHAPRRAPSGMRILDNICSFPLLCLTGAVCSDFTHVFAPLAADIIELDTFRAQ